MTKAQTSSTWRLLQLSTFQIGSAMGEILTASVWNRIMISEIGVNATPVALLLALQYLLIPISLWAGHRSDTIPLWGFRRTSYIWLGRFLVFVSFPLLALSLLEFELGNAWLGWLFASICFSLFGAGKLMSGSVFLALVRDSAPPARQGIAISLMETALIALFVVMGVVFARWMPTYDPVVFRQMVLGTMLVAGFFWWFAVFRVEKRKAGLPAQQTTKRIPLTVTVRAMWSDQRTRRFFAFLSLGTLSAWMQDVILEPLGGEVFGLTTGDTSQFIRYWGGMTIITLLVSFVIWRNRRPLRQRSIGAVGLSLMALGIGTVGVASATLRLPILYVGLVIYGLGFGLYTFGALSLMAVMSPDRDAGAYLGLWTISILLFKGLGTFLGGLLRDLFLVGGMSEAWAYGATFLLSAIGLSVTVLLLFSVDIVGFARDYGRVDTSVGAPR